MSALPTSLTTDNTVERFDSVCAFLKDRKGTFIDLADLKIGKDTLMFSEIYYHDRREVRGLIMSMCHIDIFSYGRHVLPADFSWNWVETKGVWRGTFPKRLAKWLHDAHGIKLTPEQISRIGNVAKRNMIPDDNLIIDFTDEMDWSAGDFGDGGSCFWGERAVSRGTLEQAGAWAMRYYHEDVHNVKGKDVKILNGLGRAWFVPDYPLPKCAVVFNIYGTLTQSLFARLASMVLAKYLGGRYEWERVGMKHNCDSFYLNGDGFVLYPRGTDISEVKNKGIDLRWSKFEAMAENEGKYQNEYDDDDDDDDW